MLLSNVLLLNGLAPVDISVMDGKISAIEPPARRFGQPIHFSNAFAFPGLINSHDHLDFNCFSPFGKRKYDNYREWGNHIHKDYKNEISVTLNIPEKLRTHWGIYKNLLAGVTTVVNHGKELKVVNPLINVLQHFQDLHSMAFEKHWWWKLNNPVFKKKTCIIHAGEGSDEPSHKEIDVLLSNNLLKRKLVGVHGVAMDISQSRRFRALIWCPESNDVLLGRHASIESLKAHTAIALGTDSTLSGRWNIWDHIRLARQLHKTVDRELYDMLTTTAARLWQLNSGSLSEGMDADIVVARTNGGNASLNNFYETNPEDILMVLHRGSIRMFDESMISELNDIYVSLSRFSTIHINGAVKFVEGDLSGLMRTIKSYHREICFPVRAIGPGKNFRA